MSLRSIAKLALDAVVTEARLWLTPPVAEQVTAPTAPSKWQSAAYHVEVLGSSVCPDCAEPKAVGSYRCLRCVVLPSESKVKP